MILPIFAYGSPVLKKQATEITKDYPQLDKLIADMFDTMYAASGVGLAAPQVGLSVRLFIIDSTPMNESEEEPMPEGTKGVKRAFINPVVIEETGKLWAYEEGCLSIPGIRGDVHRKDTITLRYFDENWQERTDTFTGMEARVIQHEYDHLEGKLFTEYLSPLRKQLLKTKLTNITKGNVDASYRMEFPK